MTAQEYIKNNWGENWLSVDWTAGDVVDALEEFAKMQLAGQSKMPSEEEIIEKINKLYSTWKNPDTDERMNHNDNMERYRMGFTACVKWFRNRMEESK